MQLELNSFCTGSISLSCVDCLLLVVALIRLGYSFVCAADSSGNHGGALALAAKLRGIPAHIVVPKTAPELKVQAIRRQGGMCRFDWKP